MTGYQTNRYYFDESTSTSTGGTTWFTTSNSNDGWITVDTVRENSKVLGSQVSEGWDPDKNEYGG